MKSIQSLSFKNLKTHTVAVLAFCLAAFPLFFFKNDIGGKNIVMYIILIASYYSYHNKEKEKWHHFSRGILIGLFGLMFFILIHSTLKAIYSHEEFDFMCFYLQGQLGLNHLNFYDPESFNIYLAHNYSHHIFSEEIRSDILNVGLLSPPINMLFFAPLAYLDYNVSRTLFSILVFLFIIIDTFLIQGLFFKRGARSSYSLMFIFIITLILPATLETIFYIQTNFFLLFFLLLMMRSLNKGGSGIYLALSLLFKPISAFLALFFLIKKKLKPFLFFCITCAILLFLTGIIWGFNNIIDYFKSPPTERLPHYLYLQDVNQSLLAILDRNLSDHGISFPIIKVFYFLIAVGLVVVSYVISKKLNKINPLLSLFPFIICMLIIYPSSLSHYMVYLIPVLIYFLLLNNDRYFWIIILPFFTFLKTEPFFSYLIMWGFLLFIAISKTKDEKFFRIQSWPINSKL